MLCCYLAALVMGLGANDVSARGDIRLPFAYAHRAFNEIDPPPMLLTSMVEPLARHAEIARRQMSLARSDAEQRARADGAVGNRPVELSTDLAPTSGTRVDATLSFYYCRSGPSGRSVGDGGRFCGLMRNGARVHSGAAACAARYLGQLFRIAGDPTGRTYTCTDTGSAVHGLHRDIWFDTADEGLRWQRAVGQHGVIEILP